MFKIIDDPKATVKKLAKAHASIETMEAEFEIERKATHDELISLQQKSLSGENVLTKIKAAKTKLLDLETKREACTKGMDAIKEKIAPLILVEAEARIETLKADAVALKEEEAVLYREFFEACAKAIVLRERIKGVDHEYSAQTNGGELREKAPELHVQAHSSLMESEDSAFLCHKIEDFRKEIDVSNPVKKRIDDVVDEIHKLETLIEDYDPDVEVDKTLIKYRS